MNHFGGIVTFVESPGPTIGAMVKSAVSANAAFVVGAQTNTTLSPGAIAGIYAAAYLLYVIPLMLVFHKAHRSPLWALIPIVSTVILLQIVGRSGWWILWFLIPIVNIIVLIIVFYDLARSFGHGVPFTFGLVFLSVIFLLILGLAGQYVEPASRRAQSAAH